MAKNTARKWNKLLPGLWGSKSRTGSEEIHSDIIAIYEKLTEKILFAEERIQQMETDLGLPDKNDPKYNYDYDNVEANER